MNFIDTTIQYAHVPLSIKSFNYKKEIAFEKELLDRASLYMIVKREVPDVKILKESPFFERLYDCDDSRCLYIEYRMQESGNILETVYILPKEVKKEDCVFQKKT